MTDILRSLSVISAHPDDEFENMLIGINLPEVEKKDIKFKINEDRFYIKATKGKVECAENYEVCCPIGSEKAVSNYSNFISKVQVPSQLPFEKVINVKIE
jgi:hypothetical protein